MRSGGLGARARKSSASGSWLRNAPDISRNAVIPHHAVILTLSGAKGKDLRLLLDFSVASSECPNRRFFDCAYRPGPANFVPSKINCDLKATADLSLRSG